MIFGAGPLALALTRPPGVLERVDGLASAWQAPDGEPAEQRLRERGVLRAAGFELYEPDA